MSWLPLTDARVVGTGRNCVKRAFGQTRRHGPEGEYVSCLDDFHSAGCGPSGVNVCGFSAGLVAQVLLFLRNQREAEVERVLLR